MWLTLILAVPPTSWAVEPVNKTLFGGLAIKGYDPVAYFTDGKPVMGSREFTVEWENATWRFASSRNRDLFNSDPAKYAPQYGGYCAYAVSQGHTADIDPRRWRIVAGKLYLNYNQTAQDRWSKDIPGHIVAADRNWPKLKDAK